MYHGQQSGSSLPTPDNASRSPSDSIDLSPIEAMARPMEMDQFNKPRLSSDPMAPSRGLGNPVPYGLMNFYAGDDSPWVGFNMPASASAQPSHHMNPVDVRRNTPAFASWRSNGQPSECGTIPQNYLPSDSGYESRAKQSIVDDRSVYEESTETQSLAGHMMDFNPFPLSTSTFRDTHVPSWLPAPPAPAPVQTGPTDKLICPDCQTLCKTKSELNKHHQRHLKAFKCDVHGCNRKEGFGTLNDLDRHKSSVHPELPTAGPRYRCTINQCQTKEKIWPRADNFRQHLKRVHNQTVSADDDLNQFLWHPSQKSQETSRTVQDLEGVGSEMFNFGSVPQGWEISSPEQPMEMDDLLVDPSLTNIDETSNIPLVQEHHAFVQPTQISRPPSTIKPLLPGGRTRDVQAHITVDFPKSLDACSVDLKESPKDSVIAMDCDLPPKAPESGSENERPSSQKPTVRTWSSPGEDLNEQDALKLLEKLPKELIAKFMKGQSDQKPSQEPSTSVEAHRCTKPGCIKTFNRRCELKKHMKRHDKPYGCTFSGCPKRFGSKNDWKRHENSQHFQLEVWKCSEKRTDDDNTQTGATCGKVCHRRETFRSHLQKEHKMDDASQVDKALEDCRVGRNCESRFWCGFCVKIIEITKKGANAWTERFNHIDNHYAGRDNVVKKDISEWKNVDPELHEIDFAGSVDDSSDAESCDEATASHKPSGLVMKSTTARKRGADDDNDEREPKRFRDARITQRWNCCNCSHDFDIKTTPACMECSHQRCTQCEEQQVLVH